MIYKRLSLFLPVISAILIPVIPLFPQIPIPPSDPSYIYLSQEFRRTHDLAFFLRPYPYSHNSAFSSRYKPQDRDAFLRIAPNLKVWNGIPDFRFGVWAAGIWENLSILAEPVVVHDIYGEEVLGVTYTLAGVSGRMTNAFIRYQLSNAIVQLGRSPVWWGQSWEASIVQSGNAPAYDHLSFRMNFGSFQLEVLTGQLSSAEIDTIGRIRRIIAGHRLTWLPKHKTWIVTIGEEIIYSGENRSIEWHYLNPIIPYFFSDLEKEEEGPPDADNDNSIIFLSARYLLQKNLSFYGEVIIDEFQVKKKDRKKLPDALGWKLGIDGGYRFLNRDLTFEFEFTRIDSWTYLHNGQFTNCQTGGIPIGYRYGPDCQSLFLNIDYWLTQNWLISIRDTYLEKGSLTIDSQWDPYGIVREPFPSGNVSYQHWFNPSVSWHSKLGIVELGWEGDLNAARPANLYLKLQWVNGIGFDLD